MEFVTGLKGIFDTSGLPLFLPSWGNWIMIVVGLILIVLAVKFKFEPLLLIPISLGCILVNIPLPKELASAWIGQPGVGFLSIIYDAITKTEITPIIMFLCLGALTDFSPLLERPITFLLGAAAQFGVFVAIFLALTLGFNIKEAAAIGIIGGADGPTAIFIAQKMAPQILGAIAVSAYSYMSLVPLILPPVIRCMTTKKERTTRMELAKPVSKTTKMLFPIVVTLVVGILLPSSVQLIGMLMAGNFIKECGLVERLSNTLQNELVNINTVFLGLTVGSTMAAQQFLTPATLKIILLGFLAFAFSAAGGVALGKLMYLLSGGKINPMIGAAGVSAVPMSARTVQKEGQREDPGNFLLMPAMGPNVAGVLGTAVAAAALIALLS
ncbi:MAG: sodium ion-translocating decarboxylase subunit beta [Caldisericales bacterium]|nr:sodium ion-translocating decarboxylase subunit beta [bacterium]